MTPEIEGLKINYESLTTRSNFIKPTLMCEKERVKPNWVGRPC